MSVDGLKPSGDWDWLRAEVRSSASAFAEQVRSIPDGGAQVPKLDWTVSELAAHLASLPDLYRAQNELDTFVAPADWAQYSIDARAHITERDTSALADLVQANTDAFVDELGPDPTAPRTLYGQQTTSGWAAGGLLTEFILHANDLAPLTGNKMKLTSRQAAAAIPQTMMIAPVFVDPAKAKGLDGTYGLRFRGASDWTYVVKDGGLTVSEGRPAKADAHMSADPAAFMLVALGRMNPVTPGLTGKVVVWGRKPWRMMQLGDITVDGV